MEFDEIVVKESPGLCRCCLSEGCYKDLGTEYTWMNDNEVYADMLLECFDISITQHNDGPNGPNRLICEVCITRLRDACNFKKQVLESEKKFIDMVGRGDFRPKVLIYQTQMKAEDIVEEIPAEEVEYLEDDTDFRDDELLKHEDPQESTVSEVTVEPLPVKGKRGRPRKNADVKPEKRIKVTKMEDKPKTSKAVAKETGILSSSTTVADIELSNAKEQWKLLSIILNNSTAIPFRRHGSRHKCFFCERCYQHATDLRQHTSNIHLGQELLDLEQHITEPLIKLDVTDLMCKLCAANLDNLDELIKHLNKQHNKGYPDVISQCIICFKLTDNDFGCLSCGRTFKLFGTLLLHIHCEHCERKHVCDACGLDFGSYGDLHKHTQEIHSIGEYECPYCFKKFFNKHRRDIHAKHLHESRRKCLICHETFKSKQERDRHMYAAHSQQMPWYKCDKCPTKFKVERLLEEHQRRVHLKEKNVTCEICGMRFFNTGLLNLHKVRHSDAKPYECDTCHKKFPRRSAMERHVRIHTNERRYACKVCGKAFIQWTSLQYHLPQHSDERKFRCVVCDKAFKTKKTMLKHRNNVHGKGKVVDAGGTSVA